MKELVRDRLPHVIWVLVSLVGQVRRELARSRVQMLLGAFLVEQDHLGQHARVSRRRCQLSAARKPQLLLRVRERGRTRRRRRLDLQVHVELERVELLEPNRHELFVPREGASEREKSFSTSALAARRT